MRNTEIGACNTGCSFFGGPSGGGNAAPKMAIKEKLMRKTNVSSGSSKNALAGKKDKLHLMIKQDEKRRMDDFDSRRQRSIMKKQLRKMELMRMPEDQKEAILQNPEMCCD